MPLQVSFIFGGISTEYDGSISSLTNIISSYLAIPDAERPFSVRYLYHVSRNDGLVRTIRFHRAFTISELQGYLYDTNARSGRSLLVTFDTIKSRNEYIVNLLHGQFGEDGGVQTLAALSCLRGTFGDPRVASLTMNKYAMSSFVSSILPSEIVKVPTATLVNPGNAADAIKTAKSLQRPIVVKPNSLGSSLFARLFRDPEQSEQEIEALLHAIFAYDSAALLQEFIPGDEYTCGCLVGSSGAIPLPVVKIETNMQFFGRDQKQSRSAAKRAVIDTDDEISSIIQSVTHSVASSINLCNMARFDFRVSHDSVIWFLECNYIPGLSKNGSFEKMLHHYGMTVVDLISWIASDSRPFIKPAHYIKYECI
ncbi:D-alanine-D-alanine ligase [Mesorhizobium robiniae]|uniref:D-alanine-D-alanine ligase n=1 Tax=Mesorhizobium robiniae TaxID=559315 RepID=A0ABV2H0I6_9HYPH|nr:ATP-grasp domain-containing protein [Mesorhizobium sp. ZC-5]MCV3244062.1 ATP-grasp domain-containing protein [Mesorhizobium sp. ZC-5]